MSNKKRETPAARKGQILLAAVELAKEVGYNKMTRDDIAIKAGVSMGLVTHYFETMIQLRRDVMRYARNNDIPEIIAQGIANQDKHAKKAPEALKQKAIELLVNS